MQYQNIEDVIRSLNRTKPSESIRIIRRFIGDDLGHLKALRSTLDRIISGQIRTVGEAVNDYQNEVVLRCFLKIE